jgi:PKD repeat protein
MVAFDGTGSMDSDRVENYTWTFTDGGTQTMYEVRPTYRFDRAGTFAVTLTVRDPSGNSATDQVNVTVTAATGGVQGTVKDDAGRPLAGATVRLLLGSTEVASTTTDANGAFAFAEIAPGGYNVRAELAGFTSQTADVTVVAGSTASRDLVLSSAPSGLPAWVLPVGIVAILVAVLAIAGIAMRRRKRKPGAASEGPASDGKKKAS